MTAALFILTCLPATALCDPTWDPTGPHLCPLSASPRCLTAPTPARGPLGQAQGFRKWVLVPRECCPLWAGPGGWCDSCAPSTVQGRSCEVLRKDDSGPHNPLYMFSLQDCSFFNKKDILK